MHFSEHIAVMKQFMAVICKGTQGFEIEKK
jgi:hypothetical protein